MTAATTTPPEIKIINVSHLSLFTPCPAAEGKRSQFTWGIRNGYPRVTVFTNDPNDKIMNGAIIAPMDPIIFDLFLSLMEKVIKSTEETSFKVDCFGTKYEDNKPTRERELRGELYFGKDKEGLVWVCLVAPNRPKIRFTFQISEYHAVYKKDGTVITPSEGSALAAAAYVNVLRKVMADLLSRTIENPIPRPPRAGGKGSYQKKDGNSSYDSSMTSDMSGDLLY